jgi:thiamine pyrophosphate-dependent acetolactate synthase large subunit-like protein
VAGGQ